MIRIVFTFLSLLLISCSSPKKEYSVQKFGDEFISKSVQTFGQVMEKPSDFIGQNVTLEGEIVDVCPMKGCWIEIKDFDSEKTLRVKVQDDVIIFPQNSKSKRAIVHGIFSKLEFSEEQAINWKVHLAEEKGIVLSKDEVVLVPSDLVEYRIKGIGAQIFTELN